MHDSDLCLEGDCYEEATVCRKHFNALAARLAEAVAAIEGLLNALPSATTHPAIMAARKVIAAQEPASNE
jgi:hypothetical protein